MWAVPTKEIHNDTFSLECFRQFFNIFKSLMSKWLEKGLMRTHVMASGRNIAAGIVPVPPYLSLISV